MDTKPEREPRGKGPRTLFAPKEPPARSHSLSGLSKRVLASASERLNVSESDLVDWAVRHATWGPGGEAERFFSDAQG